MGKVLNSFNTTWNPYPGSSQSFGTYHNCSCGCSPCACGPADPYGSGTIMVDRMLGNAYDTVRLVACNLPYVVEVARNMEAVRSAAANATRSIINITGTAGILGSTTVFALPAGLTSDEITDYTGLMEDSNEVIYNQASGFFSLVLNSTLGQFELTLDAAAPAELANGDVRINVTYLL